MKNLERVVRAARETLEQDRSNVVNLRPKPYDQEVAERVFEPAEAWQHWACLNPLEWSLLVIDAEKSETAAVREVAQTLRLRLQAASRLGHPSNGIPTDSDPTTAGIPRGGAS